MRGVAPGDAGQVFRVDPDDSEIVELVHSDELCREDAAIVERDANLRGAVDDVIVGDDVAIGRNDDAAADSVLDLRGRLDHLAAALWTKEPLELTAACRPAGRSDPDPRVGTVVRQRHRRWRARSRRR